MEKLTTTRKLEITREWQSYFPSLTVFRSMWLLKRNGPLLTGIALDSNRSNTAYRIIVHTHNLAVKADAVSLTLWTPLQNAHDTYHEAITSRSHSAKISEAAERLKSQAPISLTEELQLSEATAAYLKYIKSKKFLIGTPKFLYRDILTLLTWCGRKTEAESYLARFLQAMSSWDAAVLDQVGGRDYFFAQLGELVNNPEDLVTTCANQLILLKVSRVPDYGLKCD